MCVWRRGTGSSMHWPGGQRCSLAPWAGGYRGSVVSMCVHSPLHPLPLSAPLVLARCFCVRALTRPDGSVAPLRCGNAAVYCPGASQAPFTVTAGYYTAPPLGLSTNATDVMARAVECPPGSYCEGGVRTSCPPGTFGGSSLRASVSECRACSAGGYCPPGSTVPTPCGNDSVFCPAGSAAPQSAGPGYFTQGFMGGRDFRAPCDPGLFCPGDGRAYACPAGRYGDAPGLRNSSCSGVCGDGVLCPAQTASPAGQDCPPGLYCAGGLATPCPAGTFNPFTRATDASQCLPCPADTYNPGNGSSSVAQCLPCAQREGSNPGAAACWPGVLGAWMHPPPLVCSVHRVPARCERAVGDLLVVTGPRVPAAVVATDPEPAFPGLSADDVVTVYWTAGTNRPDVTTTARVNALLAFTPPLASVLRASWQVRRCEP